MFPDILGKLALFDHALLIFSVPDLQALPDILGLTSWSMKSVRGQRRRLEDPWSCFFGKRKRCVQVHLSSNEITFVKTALFVHPGMVTALLLLMAVMSFSPAPVALYPSGCFCSRTPSPAGELNVT